MPLPSEGSSGAYSVSQWCYVCMCICQVCNQSLTNVTVYIQVYMHIYIYIYIQVAQLKFGMIFTQTKTLDFMVSPR